MGKPFIKSVNVETSFYIESKFVFSYSEGTQTKLRSSFSLLFQIQKISSQSPVILTNMQLGRCFVENLLEKYILNHQPQNTVYERILFQVASENQQVIARFKYNIPFKKGRVALPVEDVNLIQGMYTCQFTKEGSRSQLNLRIRNFVGPPKHDYWIDGILNQPFQMFIEQTTIELVLCGLTLNRVYPELYEFFDEIVEKIQSADVRSSNKKYL